MGDCLPIWWHLNLNWVTSNVGKYSSPHGENVCVKGYRGPIGWQTVVGKYLSPQRENVSDNGYRGLIGWQLRHPILLSLNRETMERAGWPSTHLSFGNLNRYLFPFVYYILNTYTSSCVYLHAWCIVHIFGRPYLPLLSRTDYKTFLIPRPSKEDASDTCCSRWETA